MVIPRGKFASTNQTHYLDLGFSNVSSVWNFCIRFSVVILWGNQLWCHKMLAVFLWSGYIIISMKIIIMINIKYSYIVRNKIHFIIVTDKKSWLENRWVKLILSAMKLFPQTGIKFITSFYCFCKNLTSFHSCLQFVQKTDNVILWINQMYCTTWIINPNTDDKYDYVYQLTRDSQTGKWWSTQIIWHQQKKTKSDKLSCF